MTKPVSVRFLDRTTPPHVATLIVLSGVSAAVMNMFLPSLPNMADHFGVPYSLMQPVSYTHLTLPTIYSV